MLRTRCNNADAPRNQAWQYDLPDDGHKPPLAGVVEAVRDKINTLLETETDKRIGMLARLGWQCISTHRVTDHIGGCNGARIRCAALLMPQCKYVNSFFYFDVQVA